MIILLMLWEHNLYDHIATERLLQHVVTSNRNYNILSLLQQGMNVAVNAIST